jgi:hypothetical protein
LGHKAIPEVKGKVFVDTAQASDEMILERLNFPFSSVASMHVRRDHLKVHVFVVKELFQEGGAFIVEALELGAKASLTELGMEGLVGSENRLGGAGLHRLAGKDAVAVIVL